MPRPSLSPPAGGAWPPPANVPGTHDDPLAPPDPHGACRGRTTLTQAAAIPPPPSGRFSLPAAAFQPAVRNRRLAVNDAPPGIAEPQLGKACPPTAASARPRRSQIRYFHESAVVPAGGANRRTPAVSPSPSSANRASHRPRHAPRSLAPRDPPGACRDVPRPHFRTHPSGFMTVKKSRRQWRRGLAYQSHWAIV